MKPSVTALVVLLASIAYAEDINQLIPSNNAYGYLENIGVPAAERIRKAEERAQNMRIVGGEYATNGQFPYQVGLLISIIGLTNPGVCGGSLISANRVITAAHCWFDGRRQAYSYEVVLGSAFLFSGGVRIQTSAIGIHPNWLPSVVRNDVGVIFLPTPVTFSRTISPIALPSGSELNENFVGEAAVASGFGHTFQNGFVSGDLRYVTLNVIANSVCSQAFPQILQDTNICTSGLNNVGTCNGDSGGPLVVNRNGRPILIGVTSFGSRFFGGCDSFLPAAFARVTSYVGFINSLL